MKATAESLEFKPPQPGRWTGPVGLALVVHGLLIGALTWGIHWKDDPVLVAFETEIWSPTARQAAPAAVQPPPPEPEVKPAPRPEPKPEPKPEPPPAPPKVKDADIATEQAKKKQEEERQRREALAKEKQRAKAEADKREKAEQAEREKKLADDRKKKEAEQKKLAEQQKRKAADEQRRADQAAQAAREEQLRRIMGQAGATGGATATGTAQRSSGPSSGYAGRVVARIRPNIIYQQEFPASLRAEVEVRAAPDGTITARRVVRSSGDPEWDQAALRAIDRTGVLPRDVDGSVPPVISIVMRPRD